MLRFAWLLAGASAVTQTFYVCNDAGDLDFRGSYDLDEDEPGEGAFLDDYELDEPQL